MGQYANEQWYKERVAKHTQMYGDYPPPWVVVENSHPYSIGWRMGDGETHIMAFWEWWEQQAMSVPQRLDYFRKWPPPPRWLGWMADAIWNLEPWESEEDFDYGPYFQKLAAAGFQGTAEYEQDLDDEQWL